MKKLIPKPLLLKVTYIFYVKDEKTLFSIINTSEQTIYDNTEVAFKKKNSPLLNKITYQFSIPLGYGIGKMRKCLNIERALANTRNLFMNRIKYWKKEIVKVEENVIISHSISKININKY